MMVEFRQSDAGLLTMALKVFAKGIASADKACKKVGITSTDLAIAARAAVDAADWVARAFTDWGEGQVETLSVPRDTIVWLRQAMTVY